MEENEKTTLIRTKQNLLRNLEGINDAIESSILPLGDYMILDDVKGTVKALKDIKEILGSSENAAAKVAPKAIPGMM